MKLINEIFRQKRFLGLFENIFSMALLWMALDIRMTLDICKRETIFRVALLPLFAPPPLSWALVRSAAVCRLSHFPPQTKRFRVSYKAPHCNRTNMHGHVCFSRMQGTERHHYWVRSGWAGFCPRWPRRCMMTFYKRRADISVSADKEGGPSGRNAVLGIFI